MIVKQKADEELCQLLGIPQFHLDFWDHNDLGYNGIKERLKELVTLRKRRRFHSVTAGNSRASPACSLFRYISPYLGVLITHFGTVTDVAEASKASSPFMSQELEERAAHVCMIWVRILQLLRQRRGDGK